MANRESTATIYYLSFNKERSSGISNHDNQIHKAEKVAI